LRPYLKCLQFQNRINIPALNKVGYRRKSHSNRQLPLSSTDLKIAQIGLLTTIFKYWVTVGLGAQE
jgi:hypothetical protein